MVLLDLQGMRTGRSWLALESNMSMSCTPESNISHVMCDDDPDQSNLSVMLCAR
ncbi:SapB/AmfS family lanthipeptide [Actinomycetes bacterium KLBMP 9797]